MTSASSVVGVLLLLLSCVAVVESAVVVVVASISAAATEVRKRYGRRTSVARTILGGRRVWANIIAVCGLAVVGWKRLFMLVIASGIRPIKFVFIALVGIIFLVI